MPGLTLQGVRSVVFIGAHPDDIEIGAGGLMLALAAANPTLTAYYTVLTGTPVRQQEARAAVEAFLPGVDVTVALHGLPDGRLPGHWSTVKDALQEAARLTDPDLVVCPSPDDAHQDHRLLGELTPTAFRSQLVLHYEIPKWDGDFARRNVYLPMSDDAMRRKTELLTACFPSQKDHDWWDDELFRGVARVRGMESRSRYAEAFSCNKISIQLGSEDRGETERA